MLTALLCTYLAAILAPLLEKLFSKKAALILAAVPLGLLLYFISNNNKVLAGEFLNFSHSWIPTLNANMDFRLDGFSYIFALLITGFGFLIFLYSHQYLRTESNRGRFYFFLIFFMASMLGVVLSDNLLGLVVFWEFTSISSFFLIGFHFNNEIARSSAKQALFVTFFGGLALLVGVILLGLEAETFQISALYEAKEKILSASTLPYIIALLLIGIFTKSAQFPFHFWLPNAMCAPTPVSAYLHSVTMVKAGIYLLCRIWPIFHTELIWQFSTILFGGASVLLGAILALRCKDLKAILAYSTIAALGIMVMLSGMQSDAAIAALLTFLIAHAFYKGALFLISGILEHRTGTRDITVMGGLISKLPITAVLTFVACISLAGIFPSIGFVAKEQIIEKAFDHGRISFILGPILFLASVVFVMIAVLFFWDIFIRRKKNITDQKVKKEGIGFMEFGPIALAIASIASVVALNPYITAIISQSLSSLHIKSQEFNLHLLHGFSPALLISLLSVVLGIVLSRFVSYYRNFQLPPLFSSLNSNLLYDRLISGIFKIARIQTSVLQNGYLRSYVAFIISAFIIASISVLIRDNASISWDQIISNANDIRVYEFICCFIVLPALFYIFISPSRLSSLITLGLIGYSVAMIFLFFGAPDVATTQFLLETLILVLFILIIHKLPYFHLVILRTKKIYYFILAVAFGALITFILLVATKHSTISGLKQFYSLNSIVLGKGRNIVNVILVDFRALDTLGEITVLGIAAIGIYALLKLKLKK